MPPCPGLKCANSLYGAESREARIKVITMDSKPISEAWLTFAGFIDNQACNRLFGHIGQIIQAKLSRIHLLIQSGGGIVGDGIAMYNVLSRLPIEVVTYNAGAAESIAVLPYLAGKTRRVSKNATFMIHRS
jgi:ATP-dependent Clp protease protease subunit